MLPFPSAHSIKKLSQIGAKCEHLGRKSCLAPGKASKRNIDMCECDYFAEMQGMRSLHQASSFASYIVIGRVPSVRPGETISGRPSHNLTVLCRIHISFSPETGCTREPECAH
jgi:hypothetical protein